MILIEINREQRQYVMDMSILLPSRTLSGLRERLMNGVEYQGQFMCEVTETERSWIVERAAATMDAMARRNMSAWMTYDYRNLENMAYALFVGCAA